VDQPDLAIFGSEEFDHGDSLGELDIFRRPGSLPKEAPSSLQGSAAILPLDTGKEG
jgi:hypothetical protein